MNTTTNITAVLLGKLGEAVQNVFQQEPLPGIVMRPNLDGLASLNTASQQPAEEVLLLIAEPEAITPDVLAGLAQRPKTMFVIALTVTPTNQLKEPTSLQQQVLATADSMIVLPHSEDRPASQDTELVAAMGQTIKYLVALIQEALQGGVNVDFEDVKTVIKSKRPSAVSVAKASGKDRVAGITSQLFSSPYMVQGQAKDAARILLQILSNPKAELEMDELTEITDAIQDACGEESEVIFGHSEDDRLEQELEVFLLASY
jgi:cell division GTPase FtsZ